jgi:hypothetical protein
MQVYIVAEEGEKPWVCWTQDDAQEAAKEAPSAEITEATIDPLWMLIKRYFEFRDYKFPNREQAFLFLTSEVGELADRLVQSQTNEWVRNHPEDKSCRIEPEQADILMMLTAMCAVDHKCPIELMVNKFKEKGYDPGLNSETD